MYAAFWRWPFHKSNRDKVMLQKLCLPIDDFDSLSYYCHGSKNTCIAGKHAHKQALQTGSR